MIGEEADTVVVKGGGGDKPDIRLSVHVHVHGEASGSSAAVLPRREKGRSWIVPVFVVVAAGAVVWAAGRYGNHSAEAGLIQTAASAAAVPAPQAADADHLPPAMAAALAERPVITPPPGAPADAAPAGPAAFGLQ